MEYKSEGKLAEMITEKNVEITKEKTKPKASGSYEQPALVKLQQQLAHKANKNKKMRYCVN